MLYMEKDNGILYNFKANLLGHRRLKKKISSEVLGEITKNNVDMALLFEKRFSGWRLVSYNMLSEYLLKPFDSEDLSLKKFISSFLIIDEKEENLENYIKKHDKLRFEGRGESHDNHYFSFKAVPVNFEENKYYLFSVIDITKKKLREFYLKETEQKYRDMFENSPIALWEHDMTDVKRYLDHIIEKKKVVNLKEFLKEDSDAIVRCVSLISITSMNKKTLSLFEASSPMELRDFDLKGNLYKIFSTTMYNTYLELIVALYNGEVHFEKETSAYTLKRQKIQLNFHANRLGNFRNDWSKIEISMEDVTEKQNLLKRLQDMAHNDILTGLNNRRGFNFLAEKQIQIAKRENQYLYLFFIDMDGMKKINDRYGHENGDRALCDTACILNETFRESDIVARLGGDEFTVLTMSKEKHLQGVIKNRLMLNIQKFNETSDRPYMVKMSVGVKEIEPSEETDLDEILRDADILMYEEKKKKGTLRK